jgi:hypothetical protein
MATDPTELSLLTTLAECLMRQDLTDWEITAGALADLLEERGEIRAANYRLIVQPPAFTVKSLPGGQTVDFVSVWPEGQVLRFGLVVHGGRAIEVRSHLCALLIPGATGFEIRAGRSSTSFQDRCVVCRHTVAKPRFIVQCVGETLEHCVLPGTVNKDAPGYLGDLPIHEECLEAHPSLRPYAVLR